MLQLQPFQNGNTQFFKAAQRQQSLDPDFFCKGQPSKNPSEAVPPQRDRVQCTALLGAHIVSLVDFNKMLRFYDHYGLASPDDHDALDVIAAFETVE